MALRVTENSPKTSQRAEIASTLIVVQQTARNQVLIIYNSKGIIGAEMIQRLQAREDRGWIGAADRDLLQVLAAELKSRSARTEFRTVDRGSQEYENVGRKKALALAKEGPSPDATRSKTIDLDTGNSVHRDKRKTGAGDVEGNRKQYQTDSRFRPTNLLLSAHTCRDLEEHPPQGFQPPSEELPLEINTLCAQNRYFLEHPGVRRTRYLQLLQ
ncbi:hypothetical protein B0H16DRAFT_1474492 [Mycena metata]|uniref:Uncharacterized protein n=1 Tax=Mycena metata TaxID=1033252 RepID=A0AAD7HGH9_9AGAR|nr:hypothetical protein B0H16DRAFT_1474492 [Mycena metata]